MLGYSSNGNDCNDINPASIITNDITIANFGLFINIYESSFDIYLFTFYFFMLIGLSGITFCNPLRIILSPFFIPLSTIQLVLYCPDVFIKAILGISLSFNL